MAAALKELNLFKGSFTGYGQGYDLELVPTRLQALIMFIRVLGEEDEAMAWTGTTPFTDISKGSDAEKYVGYAYEKGYSFLQVKTVQMGVYEEYDRTNRFYLSLGFQEFEVFPTLWDEANPCQIYVMVLEKNHG